MNIKIKLGKRIKELRKLQNFSQEIFAETIGINRNSLSKIETGISFPKAETLESIAELLKLDCKDLFNFNETSDDKIENILSKLKLLDDNSIDLINSFIEVCIQKQVK